VHGSIVGDRPRTGIGGSVTPGSAERLVRSSYFWLIRPDGLFRTLRGVIDALRAMLAIPRPANRPARNGWDIVITVLLCIAAVPGSTYEPDIAWRPLAFALAVLAAGSLLWRRARPLQMILLAFGAVALADLGTIIANVDGSTVIAPGGLAGLMLTFAVFRWGSGRDAAIAIVIVLVTHFVTDAALDTPFTQSAVGSALWLLAAAVAVIFRYRADVRDRRVAAARLGERQLLARELHDTVAHHVSAIAIQAQAGRTLGEKDPEAAMAVLQTIEEAASRSLDDMRRMVGVLRDPEAGAEMAPRAGLAQLTELAAARPGRPPVEVELTGRLDDLTPTVEASMYRMAQEAITNAQRHARHATRISVRVEGDDDSVRLDVSDDGDPPPGSRTAGFGLVGMTERALLLGGSLEAGPDGDRGWHVRATVPKTGASL